MRSKTAAKLREMLLKCSKSELVEVIIKAEGLTYTTFPWGKIVSEIRLNKIEALIDANLAELDRLNEKLKAIPEERRIISDDGTRNIMIAIHNNNTEYFKLQKKHDKIFREIYG